MQLKCGGGANVPTPSSSPQNIVKNHFFDFLKVYNELGKVNKFRTSSPLFSWRNSRLKKVWAHCAPRTKRVNQQKYQVIWNTMNDGYP